MPEYFISTEPGLLNVDLISRWLRTTYWAANRPKEIVEKSLASSLCFGAYVIETKEQVGFARVVTDYATFAWICDVFVDPAHRARGLGKRLMSEIIAHPDLATTAMFLGTKDAQGLYERYGFAGSELMRRPRNHLPTGMLRTCDQKTSSTKPTE
jgi:GNAT superfamily N-acetyltransferase